MAWAITIGMVFLLFGITSSSSSTSSCAANDAQCKGDNDYCKEVIDLPEIEDKWMEQNKIFYVETSGRPFLQPRQVRSTRITVVICNT